MKFSGDEWGDVISKDTEDGPEDFQSLIERIAKAIVERQLTVPAIIFLESVKPLSFLGNQFLVFMNPIVSLVVASSEYYRFVRMMEDRDNVEKLIVAIENENSTFNEQKEAEKAQRRKSRKGLFSRYRRKSNEQVDHNS